MTLSSGAKCLPTGSDGQMGSRPILRSVCRKWPLSTQRRHTRTERKWLIFPTVWGIRRRPLTARDPTFANEENRPRRPACFGGQPRQFVPHFCHPSEAIRRDGDLDQHPVPRRQAESLRDRRPMIPSWSKAVSQRESSSRDSVYLLHASAWLIIPLRTASITAAFAYSSGAVNRFVEGSITLATEGCLTPCG